MKTLFLVVGKTTDLHFSKSINAYIDRIKHYMPFDLEIVPELKNTKNLSEAQQKEREADAILKALQAGDTLVVLDEHGKEFRSIDFAHWMEKKQSHVNRRLVFLVGGAYGFSPRIYAVATEKISLSKMTFSHQMIRLLFVEQLYRAMTILSGEPYHHE